jgi:hypothetical protein
LSDAVTLIFVGNFSAAVTIFCAAVTWERAPKGDADAWTSVPLTAAATAIATTAPFAANDLLIRGLLSLD